MMSILQGRPWPKRRMRCTAWMKSWNLKPTPTKMAQAQCFWKLQPAPDLSGLVATYLNCPSLKATALARKSGVVGKNVSVRVDLGGLRNNKKKNTIKTT